MPNFQMAAKISFLILRLALISLFFVENQLKNHQEKLFGFCEPVVPKNGWTPGIFRTLLSPSLQCGPRSNRMGQLFCCLFEKKNVNTTTHRTFEKVNLSPIKGQGHQPDWWKHTRIAFWTNKPKQKSGEKWRLLIW
jgi:hypothetical protein